MVFIKLVISMYILMMEVIAIIKIKSNFVCMCACACFFFFVVNVFVMYVE